ncbi:MAG: enoyl-CoA hydratase/isomerase family protein [Gammaproteobacteria bacterium]
MTTDSPVLTERRGDVTIVTLNSPARRNALSMPMRFELVRVLREIHADAGCRAIVVQGAAGHFCAGSDLAEDMANTAPEGLNERRARMVPCHDYLRLLCAGPKPVVAAVTGAAAGIGMATALACDFVVADETAKFVAAFGRVGYIPDGGLLWSLTQRVGLATGRDLMLTARTVDSAEASRIGLVDQLVPAGQALHAALEKTRSYAGIAPLAMREMKSLLARPPQTMEQAFQMELDIQSALGMTEDCREAKRAFLEKRPPVFKAR